VSRRSTPECLHIARREATRQRLISEGELPEHAERLVAQWELQAAKDGRRGGEGDGGPAAGVA
jgi:hypothetical protein